MQRGNATEHYGGPGRVQPRGERRTEGIARVVGPRDAVAQVEGRAVGCPATVTGGYEGFCFCSVRTDFCARTKPPAPTPPAPTPPAPTPTPAQR